MNLRTQTTLLLTYLAVAGCSGDDHSSVENNTGTIIVDEGGGSLGLAGAAVRVPPDAVDEPTQVTLSLTGKAPAELPAGRRLAGPIYMFTPHGQAFSKPVTMTFPREDGSNELWSLEGPQDELWELEAHVELDADHGTLHTTHFSYFAWLALDTPVEDASRAEDATVSPDTGFDAAR